MASSESHPQGFPGGYRVIRLVGRGTFARVFQAVAPTGETVAIKVLTSAHPQARKRFQREVKVLRALPPSPYVAAYLDHGTLDDDSPFLITEFVTGFTLGKLLATGKRFSEQAACALMIQLCKAFVGLHRLGVTHGDVKPNNVMLSKPATTPGLSGGPRGAQDVIHLAQVERSSLRIKLLDFGLVRDTQGLLNLLERHELLPGRDFAEELDAGMLAGTPEYIAPEQLTDARRGRGALARTDTAADVFALGVVFYQMLTGAVPWPFEPSEDDEVQGAVAVKRYLDARAAGQQPRPPPGIGRALWSIIARALEPDPKLRQRDAIALAEDLERYVEFGVGVVQQVDTQATMLAQMEPDPDMSMILEVAQGRRGRLEAPTVPIPPPMERAARRRPWSGLLDPGSRWAQLSLVALGACLALLVAV